MIAGKLTSTMRALCVNEGKTDCYGICEDGSSWFCPQYQGDDDKLFGRGKWEALDDNTDIKIWNELFLEAMAAVVDKNACWVGL